MKKIVSFCSLLVLVGLVGAAAASEGYYRFPDVHGDTIVFTSDDDLWSVSTSGGLARRLTSHADGEFVPRFSPDGSQIAFTGTYEGNRDVYVISAKGGLPQRLTYHPGFDEVIEWHPDGSAVLYRTRRAEPNGNEERIYSVPADGGHETLFHPFEIARLDFIDGDPDRFVYNRQNRDWRTWFRYQGGRAQDVWYADTDANEYQRLTEFPGTDAFPMHFDGRIYYVSDRSGRRNIFSMTFDGQDLQQHTSHKDLDVRWPGIDKSMGQIVYMLGPDLYLFNIGSGKTAKVTIEFPSDRTMVQPYFAKPAEFLQDFALDHEGKRVAVNVRGNLYAVPVEEGRTIEVYRNSAVRLKGGSFSPDGKQLAVVSDVSGGDEIALLDVDNNSGVEPLKETDGAYKYDPVWSPDGELLAYTDKDWKLYLVEAERGRRREVDSSEHWDIRNPTFSPDGKWLAYVKSGENYMSSLYLYNIEEREIHQVTSDLTNDGDPTWSPDGKYLYFLSDRSMNPLFSDMGFHAVASGVTEIHMLLLSKGTRSPFLPEEPYPDENKDEDEDEEKDKEQEQKKNDNGSDLPEVTIDLDGLEDRIVKVPVEAGEYGGLGATDSVLYFLEFASQGGWGGGGTLKSFDLKEEEVHTFASGVRGYALSWDRKKIAVYTSGRLTVENAGAKSSGQGETVNMSGIKLRVEPREEWFQMFDEAWRLERDFFWDPGMTGVDWQDVRKRYRDFVSRVSTRSELNDLMGLMVAELGTSHTYVYGGEHRRPDSVNVGTLGVDVVPAGKGTGFVIERLYPGDPWSPDLRSPLLEAHIAAKPGDYIVAINGEELDRSRNFFSYLVNLENEEITVALNDEPKLDGATTHILKTTNWGAERTMRYNHWVQSNLERVDEETGGKVGYIHVPDMGMRGLVEFMERYYPQFHKDGIIVDARYNGGGFVSQLLMARLTQEIWSYSMHRMGRTGSYPRFAPRGPIVVLTNAHAGSDGDIFPRMTQVSKLGTVIGTRPWGGVIGIYGGKELVDNGTITRPEVAHWDKDMGWGVENYGVDPDIVVDILPPDSIAGRDPQLDKALEVIREQIADQEVGLPEPPPIPDKSVEAWARQWEDFEGP